MNLSTNSLIIINISLQIIAEKSKEFKEIKGNIKNSRLGFSETSFRKTRKLGSAASARGLCPRIMPSLKNYRAQNTLTASDNPHWDRLDSCDP